ncbi:hypothetical protein DIPPA_26942 [Diplonema papillatum]|nr:hypothetical protein DIPPA_26942 [Diplonema papillatum]
MDGMSSSPRRWASEDGVSKIRNFEQRLVELENRLGDVEKRDEGSVRGVQMQIDGLKDALTQQQRARETLEDRKSKEVKLLENTLKLELDTEKQERREVEQLMVSQIEDRLAQLHKDVHSDGKRREVDANQRAAELQRVIDSLSTRINQTKTVSEERIEKISKVLNDEVSRLTSILSLEKQMRETTEVTMFRMLEDMCAKLQKEIAVERQERKESEETLLKLLEDTCGRAEASLR